MRTCMERFENDVWVVNIILTERRHGTVRAHETYGSADARARRFQTTSTQYRRRRCANIDFLLRAKCVFDFGDAFCNNNNECRRTTYRYETTSEKRTKNKWRNPDVWTGGRGFFESVSTFSCRTRERARNGNRRVPSIKRTTSDKPGSRDDSRTIKPDNSVM